MLQKQELYLPIKFRNFLYSTPSTISSQWLMVLYQEVARTHTLIQKILSTFQFWSITTKSWMYISFQERMRLTPERVAELNMRSPEQKWSLILAEVGCAEVTQVSSAH